MNEETNAIPKEMPKETPNNIVINGESAGGIKKNVRLRNALLRAGAAFLAAVILVSITGLAFINLIEGPKETAAPQDEVAGSFVKCEVALNFGDFTENDDGAGDNYILVPMGKKFVTIHVTDRYIESINTIKTDTYSVINGEISTLDKYIVVQGTVENLDEDLSTKMYDWFTLNKDWMVEAGIIPEVDDNAEFLSNAVLMVDTVNSINQNFVFVLTGLAVLCLLYVIVELILMAVGFYLEKPVTEETEFESSEVNETYENEEQEENKSAEESAECIECGENSGNGGLSDAAESPDSEKSEEK